MVLWFAGTIIAEDVGELATQFSFSTVISWSMAENVIATADFALSIFWANLLINVSATALSVHI